MEGFSDFEMEQKAVSYALYPKVYEDYCTHFEAYNDVTALESHVYFYGLRKGEENRPQGQRRPQHSHQFVGMSDPDKDGYRTLTFEVNGILREQKVLDKTLEVLEDRKLRPTRTTPATWLHHPRHRGDRPGEGRGRGQGQPALMIVEAMKMEIEVSAPVDGTVKSVSAVVGTAVNTDDLLVTLAEPDLIIHPSLFRPLQARGRIFSAQT
mgnify:CR=1 FL=1